MTPDQALKHFRTQQGLADALGMGQSTVADWVRIGRIPLIRQQQIQELTGGVLKSDPIPRPKPKRRASDRRRRVAEAISPRSQS